MEKTAKDEYRSRNWPRFFALAQQIQSLYPDKSRDIRLLEVTGLIRHCHWKDAADSLKKLNKDYPSSPEVARLSGLVAHPALDADPKRAKDRSTYILPNGFRWPVPGKEIRQLNPEHVRLNVVSLCKKNQELVTDVPDFSHEPWANLLAAMSGDSAQHLKPIRDAVYQT